MYTNNIKELRKLRKMTQQQLADAVGISFTVISKYESGKVMPPSDRLDAIARALGVSVDTLLSSFDVSKMMPAEKRRAVISSIDEDKYYVSTSKIAENVIRLAHGTCDLCGQRFPEEGPNGESFLESHYIEWLSKGGKNDPQNIAALCPNCHKRIHMFNDPNDLDKLRAAAERHVGEDYWR